MTRRATDFVKCTRHKCDTRGRHCHPVFQRIVKKKPETREPYWLCRTVRTNKRQPVGKGFISLKDGTRYQDYVGGIIYETPWAYETRRVAGPLMLTKHEFDLIEQHMDAEGQAYLRHESDCKE